MRHPVLRLSFGSGNFKEPSYLNISLMAQLDNLEEQLGVSSRYDTAAERFGHLVRMSSARAGQRAVILVDEYDKPILDALDAPEVARANRDFLHGLYAVVKDCDAHIRFSFITGVSKFSKVSLFSGLNNLTDITLEPDYSAVHRRVPASRAAFDAAAGEWLTRFLEDEALRLERTDLGFSVHFQRVDPGNLLGYT